MRFLTLDADNKVICIRTGRNALPGEIESDMGEIGQIMQENGTFIDPIPPVSTLEQLRQIKSEEISKSCNEEILAGFDSSAKGVVARYDFDYEAQINMLGLFTAVIIEGQSHIEWKNSEQIVCDIWTAQEYLQLYNDAMNFKTVKTKRCHTIKAMIATASESELEGISWGMELST